LPSYCQLGQIIALLGPLDQLQRTVFPSRAVAGETNGIRFNELDRQRLKRRRSQAEKIRRHQAIREDVNAA